MFICVIKNLTWSLVHKVVLYQSSASGKSTLSPRNAKSERIIRQSNKMTTLDSLARKTNSVIQVGSFGSCGIITQFPVKMETEINHQSYLSDGTQIKTLNTEAQANIAGWPCSVHTITYKYQKGNTVLNTREEKNWNLHFQNTAILHPMPIPYNKAYL